MVASLFIYLVSYSFDYTIFKLSKLFLSLQLLDLDLLIYSTFYFFHFEFISDFRKKLQKLYEKIPSPRLPQWQHLL